MDPIGQKVSYVVTVRGLAIVAGIVLNSRVGTATEPPKELRTIPSTFAATPAECGLEESSDTGQIYFAHFAMTISSGAETVFEANRAS